MVFKALMVEISGIEPLTSWMPFKRSPSWAIPPYCVRDCRQLLYYSGPKGICQGVFAVFTERIYNYRTKIENPLLRPKDRNHQPWLFFFIIRYHRGWRPKCLPHRTAKYCTDHSVLQCLWACRVSIGPANYGWSQIRWSVYKWKTPFPLGFYRKVHKKSSYHLIYVMIISTLLLDNARQTEYTYSALQTEHILHRII